MSNSEAYMPRLKQLIMQKWKPEQVYEKVRISDEESPSRFPIVKGGWRVSLTKKICSGFPYAVIAILMTLCITGIVWWPARIQSQAIRTVTYRERHQDHSSNTAHGHPDTPYCEPLDSHHAPHPQATDDNTVATCGSTVEEAKSLNCIWDLLAMAWLPPACIDEEITDDFRNQGPWRYFADARGTEELSEEELQYRVGEGMEVYTSLKWHKVHCSYQWRKMHKAMQRGTKIEDKLADYHHTMHCGYVQMQQGDMDDLFTKVTIEFMTC